MVDTVAKKTKQWRPDMRIAEMLKGFWLIPVTAEYAAQQKVPFRFQNIDHMPNIKTIFKYFNYFNEEAALPLNKSLATQQRQVRARFLQSYDKNIMVTEDQIQKLLKFRDEEHAAHLRKVEKADKGKILDPEKPNIPIELALSRFNDIQGSFKIARAAIESASFIDQRSEVTVIREMEDRLAKTVERQQIASKKKKKVKA